MFLAPNLSQTSLFERLSLHGAFGATLASSALRRFRKLTSLWRSHIYLLLLIPWTQLTVLRTPGTPHVAIGRLDIPGEARRIQ